MIDKLRSMAVFARVAEAESFRRAAERLGLSASVVSHHITQLEEQLGCQLLRRSTRHVALTEEGKRFYASCSAMLQSAESALDSVLLKSDELSGKISILAPAPFSSGPFLRDITAFCLRYPKVQVEMDFDDRPRNLLQEGIDLAICFEPSSSAQLACRELFRHRPGLYAAPGYLERHGPIERIEDLLAADWVSHKRNAVLDLESDTGETVRTQPVARLWVSNIVAMHEAVRRGLGVAQLAGLMVQEDIANGVLVPVLPTWRCQPVGCYLVHPAKLSPHSLTHHFIGFLEECIRESAPPHAE